jgi:hypothetical protein
VYDEEYEEESVEPPPPVVKPKTKREIARDKQRERRAK